MIKIDSTRDALLTDFGKETLKDRYLLEGESFQEMFSRVALAYADDREHAQRLYDYMSNLWFMPSTPILSNGGTNRGLPISCFLNSVKDTLEDIADIWHENIFLASHGGGIGTCWTNVRGIGEKVGKVGISSGIISFIKVQDSLALAVSQGALRRGSSAVYIDIHHPEIEEFLEIRKPSGDFNRKSLNLHHGITITDEFMEAVKKDLEYNLRSPKTGETLKTLNARNIFQKILETRLATGEPYLIFIDHANKNLPYYQKKAKLKIEMSNLCSEILLPTGKDHLGNERTAVCCLSSVNLEKWDEWKNKDLFIEDILRFLDNVLQDFIDHAPPVMRNAIYSATRERAVGLGVMGFHSFLQSKSVPFGSATAKSWNRKFFKDLKEKSDKASKKLALEKGSCPDAQDFDVIERFSHKIAIAPTASISGICGGVSACIEPIPANIYTTKTLSGSFTIKNKHLEKVLDHYLKNTEEVWQSIIEKEGSVQHLDFLSEFEKDVFKTAFEIDQRWIVDLAGDRSAFICQGQSINLFLPADVDKWDLLMIHWRAWEWGIKSLYYCRSKSIQRAEYVGDNVFSNNQEKEILTDYEECLSCQ